MINDYTQYILKLRTLTKTNNPQMARAPIYELQKNAPSILF
jgi:hypothetical protein